MCRVYLEEFFFVNVLCSLPLLGLCVPMHPHTQEQAKRKQTKRQLSKHRAEKTRKNILMIAQFIPPPPPSYSVKYPQILTHTLFFVDNTHTPVRRLH